MQNPTELKRIRIRATSTRTSFIQQHDFTATTALLCSGCCLFMCISFAYGFTQQYLWCGSTCQHWSNFPSHYYNIPLTRSTKFYTLLLRSSYDSDFMEGPSDASVLPFSSLASSVNEFSFFDEAILYVRGGSGGQGAATYKKGAVNSQDGKADGGNGGDGGSVIIEVDKSLNTLVGLSSAWRPNAFGGSGAAVAYHNFSVRPMSFRAENGMDGERRFKNGRRGKDVTIRVPPGTVVNEVVLNDDGDIVQSSELVSLSGYNVQSDNISQQTFVIARGGEGGEGSGVLGRNRGVRRPRVASTGGERKTIKLTLKIVADACLVGVPNAGKSTLLAAVTRAKPKIADYPFTTIIPNLGVWVSDRDFRDIENDAFLGKGSGSEGLVLCDVPGLIAGASRGIGLGHAFLRHVERCYVIVHLIDATSNDPIADYLMINEEIQKYGSDSKLASIPQVVVVNKVDLLEENRDGADAFMISTNTCSLSRRDELERKLKEVMPHSRLLWISAKGREGVDDLMIRLSGFVKKIKETNGVDNV